MLSKIFFSLLAEHVEVGLKIQGSDEDGDNNSHLLFAYPQFTWQTDTGVRQRDCKITRDKIKKTFESIFDSVKVLNVIWSQGANKTALNLWETIWHSTITQTNETVCSRNTNTWLKSNIHQVIEWLGWPLTESNPDLKVKSIALQL